jgi:hypothetical protein
MLQLLSPCVELVCSSFEHHSATELAYVACFAARPHLFLAHAQCTVVVSGQHFLVGGCYCCTLQPLLRHMPPALAAIIAEGGVGPVQCFGVALQARTLDIAGASSVEYNQVLVRAAAWLPAVWIAAAAAAVEDCLWQTSPSMPGVDGCWLVHCCMAGLLDNHLSMAAG